MHLQARARTQKSPPNVVEFLNVLADDQPEARAINVEGVTGSAVEDGGFLVFAVAHGREQEAHDRLKDERYRCQWTMDLYAEKIPPDLPADQEPDPNVPGVLAGIVDRAKRSKQAAGRPVHEILLGAFTDEPGRFFVQVTFVGADWQDEIPEVPPQD